MPTARYKTWLTSGSLKRERSNKNGLPVKGALEGWLG